ncbi:MAG: hypothetical protein LLG04_17610 [Parachlamydia sp.]|nr:hypothetical protein [Parachlamydia sp.]
MSFDHISIGGSHTAAATQPDIEAAQPQREVTERTHLVGSAALEAAQETTSYFRNLSTKQKLSLAAMVTLGIGGVAMITLLATYAFSKDSENPPPPTCWKPPHNATEICNNAMTAIGSKYLEWLPQAPNITTLTSMQNGIRQMFCNGTKVIDPETIAWAQNIIPQLSSAIANQTSIALTGAPYDPSNPYAHQSIPQRLYNLIFHANADFKETDNWFGMEDFYAPAWIQFAPQNIPFSLMRQGATMALKEFCDRLNFSDILFNNGTYTYVKKQFADYIPDFAGWCFWPKS